MIANDTATRATGNTPTVRRGRVAIIALWVTQIALAAMFLFAGGAKLVGAPAMVTLFAAIGLGQWFRYVTGAIEISAAVALLIPSSAPFGAILIVLTMFGAAIANLSMGQSPAVPLVLLLVAAVVAWTRRNQLPGCLFSLNREVSTDSSADQSLRACHRKRKNVRFYDRPANA